MLSRKHTLSLILLIAAGCDPVDPVDPVDPIDPDQPTEELVDADGDGFYANDSGDLADCDDEDSSVYPGAAEVCDGLDNDCDDLSDNEPVDGSSGFFDDDGDGVGGEAADELWCELPEGIVDHGGDCDDGDAGLGDIGSDGDCDGVLTPDDCDDSDPDSTTLDIDGDCDGVLTFDDCDDDDPSSSTVDEDSDCDGVVDADRRWVHIATSGNITSNWTVISDPLLDGEPDAVIMVTANWSPPGGSNVYNDSEIGVWYDGEQWGIYNQDLAAMPEGAAFNVYVPPDDEYPAVHAATSSNIVSNWTVITDSLLDGDPGAVLFVTQNWNPGGGRSGNTYNDSEIGVWYDGSKWGIYNQDLAAMPEGADFNIVIPESGDDAFVHSATSSNIISNWTELTHTRLDGDPDAQVQVTQNWNPGGGRSGNTYNDSEIGVWYNGSKWSIYNQDLAAMPEGADFNVLIPR